jgi:hypothetical protein
VSVGRNLFVTTDIWVASCLVYLYGKECLARIQDEELGNRRYRTTYNLAVPSEDAQIVVGEYERSEFALSSAKHFVGAYQSITARQNAMRRRGENDWCSPDWIAGKVG